ncbi:MAG: B12-binding domain-containing radical SAM protein [Candidatus Nitrosocosmicus sp.]|nr:B12-binding domain-containing radical SAM protein [Candidatus Nitrosocosmicus sp.]MDN5866669.1 B12-binding domain-containing radical SAM protein [Candidatus Nitrosocosmicus sp.]
MKISKYPRIGFISTDFHTTPSLYQGSRKKEEPLDILYAIATCKKYGECRLVNLWETESDCIFAKSSDILVLSTTNSYLQWNNHPLGLENFLIQWRKVKEVFGTRPLPKIIVFGPHVAAHWKELLALGIDSVILGEAEFSISIAVSRLIEDQPLDDIDGLMTSPSQDRAYPAIVRSLNELPRIAYEETIGVNYAAHNHPNMSKFGHLYEGSRGCPYQCSFCNTITHRSKYRTKHPSKVEEELKWLASHSRKDYVYFIDESFGANDDWAFDVLERLEKIPLQFGCQSNLSFLSDEKIRRFQKAKFISLEFGLETGNESILRKIGKDNRLESAAEHINNMAKLGLNPLMFILFGLPNETKETISKTMRFLSKLDNRVRVSVTLPTPYIDTQLYKQGINQGLIKVGDKGNALYQYTGLIGNKLCYDRRYVDKFRSTFGPNSCLSSDYIDLLEKNLTKLFNLS